MAGRKKKIWIIGDSTVNAGEDSASCIPRIGWGDTIASFFKDDVIVCNIAISGTSSKSFRTTLNYQKFLTGIKPEDAVLVCFGHNDEKRGIVTFTSGNGDEHTKGSFAESLYEGYIHPVHKAGVHVILVTPIVRRADNGDYHGDRVHVTSDGDYPESVRRLGEKYGVPVVDLTRLTRELSITVDHDDDSDNDTIWQHGRSGRSDLCVDNTHTSLFGAQVNSWLVARELIRLHTCLEQNVIMPLENPLLHASEWKRKSFNPDYIEPVYVCPEGGQNLFPDYVDPNGNTFCASAFGDVMLEEKVNDFEFGQGADGSMRICAGKYENNGKIEESSDGLAMYFVRIPAGVSFQLSGVVCLESYNTAGSAAIPSGFGTMVRDDMYINQVNGSLMGDYIAGGIAFRPGCEKGSITFARRNGKLMLGRELSEQPETGIQMKMSVFSTGDGYGARVGDFDPVIAGYDFALTRVDPEYIYVGFLPAGLLLSPCVIYSLRLTTKDASDLAHLTSLPVSNINVSREILRRGGNVYENMHTK